MLCLPEWSVTTLDVVHCADWRVLVGGLADQSIDMCLADTPYGTTACAWDTVIDLDHWWREMRRVMKPRGAVVMTASQPYTSMLVMSNLAWFKHEWVWDKHASTGFLGVAKYPLKRHENVLVFGRGLVEYYPQMRRAKAYYHPPRGEAEVYGSIPCDETVNLGWKYPTSIIDNIHGANIAGSVYHPTQKPVALFEYLIRTYTNEGDTVLDPFVGSGTTALAARSTGRHFICGDLSREYVEIARYRLRAPLTPLVLTEQESDVSDLPLFAAAGEGAA